MTDLGATDTLEDFEAIDLAFHGSLKRVWRGGRGPGTIVMHEMPGITPQVARFARAVRDAGFTVWMPSLFGRDGHTGTADEGAEIFRRACMSAEFRALGGGASSPVTVWLMALARHAHEVCGGPGVGAVGMCFTGNFALSMMLEPSVLAPVLCQPSLPLDQPSELEISAEELEAISQRLEREGRGVLAYRFAGDAFCKAERFEAYRQALGDRFDGRVLPDAAASSDVPPFFRKHVPTPHSVVTVHLVDRAGEPTRDARNAIIAFLTQALSGQPS